jgi:hypothetical protein
MATKGVAGPHNPLAFAYLSAQRIAVAKNECQGEVKWVTSAFMAADLTASGQKKVTFCQSGRIGQEV